MITRSFCVSAAGIGGTAAAMMWCNAAFKYPAMCHPDPVNGTECSGGISSLQEQSSPLIEPLESNVEEEALGLLVQSEEVERELEQNCLHPLRDTALRFAPYANYLAYSSDVGESFRIVASAKLVTRSYYVAGAYCLSDIVYNASKEYEGSEPPDWGRVRMTALHAAVFQLVASVALPFAVIHTAVHTSKKHVFQKMAKGPLQRWGPSAVALCLIPFLPIVDEPVEDVIDWAFGHIQPHRCDGHAEAGNDRS